MTNKPIITSKNFEDLSNEEKTFYTSQAEKDSIEKTERIAYEENIANLKTSAKAKLIAGEALTEEEANTIVL